MNILLTGAAGFIGSHTAERLLAAGHQVTGLDNFDPYYDVAVKRRNLETALRNERYRFVEGDFTSAEVLDRLLPEGRFDAVIHLAAQAGVRPSLVDPLKYARVNVSGVITLLEALRRHGPGKLVAASSSSVYGNTTPVPFREDAPCIQPQSPYGASKRAGEVYCGMYSQLYGLKAIVVRPFTVYGPRQRPDMAIASFARKILLGETITLFGDGSSARDYTFVDDLVGGLLGALAFPVNFGIYNLGGEHPISLSGLVETLERVAGKKAVVERAPMQAGDVERTYADVARARKDLGYDPAVPLEEGLRRTVAWVRQELAR